MSERSFDTSSGRRIQFSEYKPQSPQNYQFPRPITRDNFASMLATSFRVSGNKSDRHLLYFELLKVHTGFNYLATIGHFLESGGWDTFSVGEQQLFMKNFDSVRSHRTAEDGVLWEDFHREPGYELAAQLLFFDEDDGITERAEELVTAFQDRYGSLARLNQQEFLVHLNEMHPLRN